ncbi:MAG: hypothetical protein M0P99_01610 [Candidatus Cloacimonetes bacterium]|nr:hypothetical protein [Candidatus Cloacimonadota bacterium]
MPVITGNYQFLPVFYHGGKTYSTFSTGNYQILPVIFHGGNTYSAFVHW